MTRSFIHLRTALLGASCAIVFGFGASAASALPQRGTDGTCAWGTTGAHEYCAGWCQQNFGSPGRCFRDNTCLCLY